MHISNTYVPSADIKPQQQQCHEDLTIDLAAICENLIASFIWTFVMLFVKFLFWVFQPHVQRFKLHISAIFRTPTIEDDQEAVKKAHDEEDLHSLILKFDEMERNHEFELHKIDESLKNRLAGLESSQTSKNNNKYENDYPFPSAPPITIPDSAQIGLIKRKKAAAKNSKRHHSII